MKTQVCNCCGIEKNINEFYFRKETNQYRKECKQCKLKKDHRYYENNKESKNSTSKKYYLNNKEAIQKRKKEYYSKNKKHFSEINKEYRKKHREELNEYAKEYRKIHQKEITTKRKEKRHNEPKYYFEVYLRNKINNYLYRYGKIKKKNNVQEILGCNFLEFKNYIENKFQKGMSWNNRGEWHLDHIIPLATAKNYDDLVRLNHYSNFQPLWAEENLRKGAKI